jgi:hypothetical protein
MGMSCQFDASDVLLHDIHLIGGWVGSKANLNGGAKRKAPYPVGTLAVQPVDSHYSE